MLEGLVQLYERGDILSGFDEAVDASPLLGGGGGFVLLAGSEGEEAAEEAKPRIEAAEVGG